MEYKQVILVRQDLKMPKGKMASQCAHAAVESVLKTKKEVIKKWHAAGMKKVVLKVKDKEELFKYKREAEQLNLVIAVITDAGKTYVAPGTITCMAIGPDKEEEIDKVTGELRII